MLTMMSNGSECSVSLNREKRRKSFVKVYWDKLHVVILIYLLLYTAGDKPANQTPTQIASAACTVG